jgi:hypothetical protein
MTNEIVVRGHSIRSIRSILLLAAHAQWRGPG